MKVNSVPITLIKSIPEIERKLGRSIEALIAPLADVGKMARLTKKIIDKKIRPTYAISSRNPLVTRSIMTCNSLVLIGDENYALFHEHPEVNPESYLSPFFETAKSQGIKYCGAIQVAGESDIYKQINLILRKHNISVVASYLDDSNNNWTLRFPEEDSCRPQKDIFVFPESKEVIVYRRNSFDFFGNKPESTPEKVLYYRI